MEQRCRSNTVRAGATTPTQVHTIVRKWQQQKGREATPIHTYTDDSCHAKRYTYVTEKILRINLLVKSERTAVGLQRLTKRGKLRAPTVVGVVVLLEEETGSEAGRSLPAPYPERAPDRSIIIPS